MANIRFKGDPVHTVGDLPPVGTMAPDFELFKGDLSMGQLSDFRRQRVILNIFPSVDTRVCATSVRRFNQEAISLKNVVVLCISKDLPFAQSRFCGTEGIDRVIMLSDFRSEEFGKAYGLKMIDGPLAGLLARAVIFVDESGKVLYTELVEEITQEPNYQKALAHLA